MLEVLEQLARMAAVQATANLAQQTFGGIDEIRLEQALEQSVGTELYYRLRWAAYSMGLPGQEINMVVLPEFLSEELEDLEYFQEQLTAYIVEKILEPPAES